MANEPGIITPMVDNSTQTAPLTTSSPPETNTTSDQPYSGVVETLLQLAAGPVGAWEMFVPMRFVKDHISSLPLLSETDKELMVQQLVVDYGKGIVEAHQRKLCAINQVFLAMTRTPVQDPRMLPTTGATGPTRNIIQVDRLHDEVVSGVQRFLRPDRNFTVHDPLAFNMIVREMQAEHPCFHQSKFPLPKTTKPTSEVLGRVGIGPPEAACVPHKAHLYRGPADTDPKFIDPYDGEKQPPSKRDGMYYKRYVTDLDRAERLKTRHIHTKKKKVDGMSSIKK
jgi:hypothetical protein